MERQFVANKASKALYCTMIWLSRITPHSQHQARKRPNKRKGVCPTKHGLS